MISADFEYINSLLVKEAHDTSRSLRAPHHCYSEYKQAKYVRNKSFDFRFMEEGERAF
jgi:hypothetical protein